MFIEYLQIKKGNMFKYCLILDKNVTRNNVIVEVEELKNARNRKIERKFSRINKKNYFAVHILISLFIHFILLFENRRRREKTPCRQG